MGPPSFSTMADVVDEQGAFPNPAVDGFLHLGITLPTWGGHLGVGVHENALDVKGAVVFFDALRMTDAIERVTGFRGPAIAIKVVGDKANPVAPGAKGVSFPLPGQASLEARCAIRVGVAAAVRDHLGDGIPSFIQRPRWNPANPDEQGVRQPLRGPIGQESEVIVGDITLRWRVALGTLEGDEGVAIPGQVAVLECPVAKQLEIPGRGSRRVFRPVV